MTSNCNDNTCASTTGPFPSAVYTPPAGPSGTLVPLRPGSSVYCPANPSDQVSPFQLVLSNDACIQDAYLTNSLQIGGAVVNIYKLLGVHEQCKLVDCSGWGTGISNGDGGTYVAANAFDKFATEWHSAQTGSAVPAGAFIGYDFGEIKTLDQSRRMYGVDTAINKHITAFAIKQSANAINRVTQVRLEYSQDKIQWYGAGLATLPDDDCLNTILMRRSAPARYWRLRPTKFNGSGTGDGTCDSTQVVNGVTLTGNFGAYWGVQAIQLFHNYMATEIDNIQDPILMENRDRDYATDPVLNKGYYDLVDTATELSRFGIEMTESYNIQLSFSATVALLGRPVVIGDIIELPSQTQYSAQMRPIKKWLEVTDVAWATNGFTPGWQPLLLKVTAMPAMATQETQDIFGDLAEELVEGGLGLMDKGNGRNPNYQDFSNIARTISRTAEDEVPERGREGSGLIREFTDQQKANAQAQGLPAGRLQSIGLHAKGPYTEDAMPPNNLPYTTGTALPPINSTLVDGSYFRLTYTGLSADTPARLYRYSKVKGRWLYLQTDLRGAFATTKPMLQEFLTSPSRTDEHAILQRNVGFCNTTDNEPNSINP